MGYLLQYSSEIIVYIPIYVKVVKFRYTIAPQVVKLNNEFLKVLHQELSRIL